MFRIVLKFCVYIGICALLAFLSYRVAKISGHWEYGLLTFMVSGWLFDISYFVRNPRRIL